jgi:hypothetical protein
MARPRDEARVSLAEVVAALGALLLLASLFVDWYGPRSGAGGLDAWSSFELVDLILAGLALATLVSVAESALAPGRGRMVPVALVRWTGPVALLLVVVALVNHPPVFQFATDVRLETGIWLALAGSLLICASLIADRVRVSVVMTPRPEREPRSAEPADPHAETTAMAPVDEPGVADPPS